MAHLQYMPGDSRLVDQLVYELKSKGIFDQFRKECIADVDTRPAYQNLRQRVESSVSTFLARQCWKPDLNKNQLREKLRKHILDGNYLEQGVERIVDQVVNPKVASVFIPQVEDLVYNYLGITRKKAVPIAETSNDKVNPDALLPTDLEAVSPGSVKSNDDKNEATDTEETKEETEMEIDQEEAKSEPKEDVIVLESEKKENEVQDTQLTGIHEVASHDSNGSMDKGSIPLPFEEIKLENIPAPDNSPPKVQLEKIELPKEPNLSTDIPLPDEIPKMEKDTFFKPINSDDDDDSSSDSSLRRNMSPLTPIRNFNNENSCDAQQAFENDSDVKSDEKKEPSTFRFTIESQKVEKMTESSSNGGKIEKKELEQDLSHQFNNQVNINAFNTPLYDDSSNSHNLHIDYESDANSKTNNAENKLPEAENSEDSKKERKNDDKKNSHNSSHHSRDSHRHSSSKDKRSDSKHSTSRDGSRHDKKSSSTKDDGKSKSRNKERDQSRDKSEKKDAKDSKHRSSHKSSSHKDSTSHRSSSSSQRHSSKHDDKKSSSSKDKNDKSDKTTDKNSKDKPKDAKSSHRSDRDKDRKSSSKKTEDKDKKKDKKEADDHYSLSGRGSHTRRSTDRDSNDGSSSSKGSHNPSNQKSKSTDKKESKGNTSKSDNTSTSGESRSPTEKEHIVKQNDNAPRSLSQCRPCIVRIDNHLEVPIASPPRLPFVPDVTLKKPKFAANLQEAKRLMKMRKFLDEEQKRMNQEAALLLEFQANVRPSLSQVYSSIPGPELEFACVTNSLADNQAPYEVTAQQIDNINQITKAVHVVDAKRATKIEDLENLNQIADIQEVDNMRRADAVQNVIGVENIAVLEPSTVIKPSEPYENNNKVNNITFDVKNATTEDNLTTKITNEMLKIHEMDEKLNDESIIVETENNVTYNENKPFSQLMEEISEYSKASENKMKVDSQEPNTKTDAQTKLSDYFEVTIITEEFSESEDTGANKDKLQEISEEYSSDELRYFAEQEKYDAEIERDKFNKFLKAFTAKRSFSNKMYLLNCNTYEENVIKEVSLNFGEFKIVNYHKNGYLKVPKNIVKNVNLSEEITLPLDNSEFESKSVFSPVKSECSFELSSDYDAKLEEMVNKTSRQEVLEIILGGVLDESPSKMPKIDYYTELNIESDSEKPLKRKLEDIETIVNNNRQVLTSNKIRKLSDSDQISSTTEEAEETSNNNKPPNNTRSKYLGRARRVGLPRPKKSNLPNSPSSDKSVENYEQSPATPTTPNGKIKSTQRNKVQRYDLSDLYKPKLHYLSRRNNIS